MQQAREDTRFLSASGTVRRRTMFRTAERRATLRKEISSIIRTPSGFARFDNVAACTGRPRGGISARKDC
jgi:hypothetical protein